MISDITAPMSTQTIQDIIQESVNKITQKTFNLQDFTTNAGVLTHASLNPVDLIHQIFESSKSKLVEVEHQAILDGSKTMVTWVLDNYFTRNSGVFDILFFPSPENEQKLVSYFKNAKKQILVCVFTISNHHIANALREAHERGLDVRIITDDVFAAKDESDVQDLAREGVQVRTDDSKSALMHNKFAVIDDKYLVTGSYNWTAQATYHNQENVVILENNVGVTTFKKHFEDLWVRYASFSLDKLLNTAVHKTKLFENQRMEEEKHHQKEEKQHLKEEKIHQKEHEKEEKQHHKEEKQHEKEEKKNGGTSTRSKRKPKKDDDDDEDEEHSDVPKIAKGSKNIKHDEKSSPEKSSPKKRQHRAKVAKD